MTSIDKFAVIVALAGLAFAACDGRSLDPGLGDGGGTGGAAGTAAGGSTGTGGTPTCAAVRVSPATAIPPEHRATPKACSPSNAPPVDGGAISCTTSADCGPDGGLPWGYNTCLHGVCSFDQCLTDADCGSSGVCACSSDYYGGNAAYHANVCVPGNCRVDADCGAGGYCSPSHGYCGSFEGFYCHRPADSCVDPTTDCAGCGNACVYAPTVGAFTCGTAICAG